MPKKLGRYYELQKNYENKYNKNTIVFIRLDKFFKAYFFENHVTKYGYDFRKICDKLQMSKYHCNRSALYSATKNCMFLYEKHTICSWLIIGL